MQNTIDRINNKIDLLNNLKGAKKAQLSVLSVLDTVFVVYNLGFIGRFEDKDGKALNDFLKYHDVSLSNYDIDAIAFKDEEMSKRDNWCFDSEDFLDSFVELNDLNNITKDIIHDMKVQTGTRLDLHMVDELINEKIRIHEEVPVTNSISLATEFTIKSLHINTYIEETINMYPLLIKDVTFGFHKSDETHYNKHINVTEDLYEKFLRLIPKGKEKVTEFKRVKALSEYFNGFKKLRQYMYDSELGDEIEIVLQSRRHQTNNLKFTIHSLLKDVDHEIDSNYVYRTIFDIVNNKLELDPITFNGSYNRNIKDIKIQKDIKWLERKMAFAINSFKTHIDDIVGIVKLLSLYVMKINVEQREAPDFFDFVIKYKDKA